MPQLQNILKNYWTILLEIQLISKTDDVGSDDDYCKIMVKIITMIGGDYYHDGGGGGDDDADDNDDGGYDYYNDDWWKW